MTYACACKGIPKRVLKDELDKVAGSPVDQESLHRKLGGDDERCCGNCREPGANRIFAEMVDAHNDRVAAATAAAMATAVTGPRTKAPPRP